MTGKKVAGLALGGARFPQGRAPDPLPCSLARSRHGVSAVPPCLAVTSKDTFSLQTALLAQDLKTVKLQVPMMRSFTLTC